MVKYVVWRIQSLYSALWMKNLSWTLDNVTCEWTHVGPMNIVLKLLDNSPKHFKLLFISLERTERNDLFPANSRKDITIVDSYGLVQKFSDESSAVKDKHIRPKIPSKEYSAAKSETGVNCSTIKRPNKNMSKELNVVI
ncbi:uncharacterized protein OCT59_006997 [Rhizophagus irregularis]|uniref:uncharacterized protein n=1 Tax=Rhizophagus irregularis TaxID=588596 RepID=UPI001C1B6073|nr:hypothetical protein OCT59_006997 [Rhizophagus irregularis]CAB4388397.1 unnamed protein product [Rhizophagus irregularis]CAB4488071.1 unnamed protein product [Rhizophagus irregularis]CAB5217384.1 unnamed protein product [Rhizophagus irregularis]CAB5386248.1 unnamed protein product [Rhizophagus irregularis]